MKERLQLQLSVEEGEKDIITKFYKDRAMSVAGRALMLLREDIKKMEADNKRKDSDGIGSY